MRISIIILLVLIVAGPWAFEQITFYYYLHDPVIFFAYSGTRMPLFIIVEFALGASIGFLAPRNQFGRYVLAGVGAIAVFAILAYQLCDARACYYTGPDRLGEIRFLVVLASGFITGSIIGNLRRRVDPLRGEFQKASNLYPFYFAVPVFVGSFASALLYNVPGDIPFTLLLFAGFLASAFLATGIFLPLFVKTTRMQTVLLCVSAMLALFFLFRNWSTVTEANGAWISVIQLIAGTAGAALAAGIGYSVSEWLSSKLSKLDSPRDGRLSPREKSLLVSSMIIVVAFGLFNSHPGVYAPLDILPRHVQANSYSHMNWLSGAPDPVYYSGAYNTGKYFPTKRVEVTLNITGPLRGGRSLTIAGMGAQSPNCCKDGLDYGYRTDVAETASGRYFVVARAWETCDQNAGCSGFPWQSTMHETDQQVAIDFPARISLAMAWPDDGGRTVHWYYRMNDARNWTEFSTFAAPKIENPYFNLGVDYVGDYAHNFPVGNANFFQVGLAMQNNGAFPPGTAITFECPAYYDKGQKHCFPGMEVIHAGNSHWKVLWQWGLQGRSDIQLDDVKHITRVFR